MPPKRKITKVPGLVEALQGNSVLKTLAEVRKNYAERRAVVDSLIAARNAASSEVRDA